MDTSNSSLSGSVEVGSDAPGWLRTFSFPHGEEDDTFTLRSGTGLGGQGDQPSSKYHTSSSYQTTFFRLRDLPIEIRILIFRLCVATPDNNQTPALIKALRGDPQLYHEALEVYYAINTFTMSFHERRGLK